MSDSIPSTILCLGVKALRTSRSEVVVVGEYEQEDRSLVPTRKSDISFSSLTLGGTGPSHVLRSSKMGAEISLIRLVHLVGKSHMLSHPIIASTVHFFH